MAATSSIEHAPSAPSSGSTSRSSRRLRPCPAARRREPALAAILLSRFDLLLLDEPTNDLDFDGLERLERFLAGFDGGLAVVSHDRAFLDRTIRRIVEIDPWTHRVKEWAGTWSDYEAARDLARERQYEAFADSEERRREVEALLAARRTQAHGAGGMADRRGTKALAGKVRQAKRSLERISSVEKPYEPWELKLSLAARQRPGDSVVALEGAVGVRGDFRLGPIDLDLAPGERVAITGRNGSGKSTLLALLLGELPLAAGRRRVGRSTVLGSLDQRRQAYDGPTPAAGSIPRANRADVASTRAPCSPSSTSAPTTSSGPARRSHRASGRGCNLAELMARGVNCLVLDEPTNHLDLEAIEELETALAVFEGTTVVVSHDRRFLERVAPTRELAL